MHALKHGFHCIDFREIHYRSTLRGDLQHKIWPHLARNYGKGTNQLKLLSKTRHWVDLHETYACSTPDNLPLMPKSPQFFVQLTLNPQYTVSVKNIQLRRTAYSLYVAISKPSLVQPDMMLRPVDTTTNNSTLSWIYRKNHRPHGLSHVTNHIHVSQTVTKPNYLFTNWSKT
jgi:hypothetical protein